MAVIQGHFKQMAEKLSQQLGRVSKKARGVRITVKFQNFRLTDKSAMLTEAAADPDTIFKTACELFTKVKIEESIRLVGVSVKDLVGVNSGTRKSENKAIDSFFSSKTGNNVPGNKSESNCSPDKAESTPPLEQKLTCDPPRMSEEDLERELDDLEAMMTEKLDQNEEKSNASAIKFQSEEKPLKDISDRMNISKGSALPQSFQDRSSFTGVRSNPLSSIPNRSNQVSGSKKPKFRVITLEEQFRSTLAGGALSSRDQSDMSETNTPRNRLPDLMHCPICNQEINTYGFVSRLNKHIDECLIPKKSKCPDDSSNLPEETPGKEPKKAAAKQVRGLQGFFSSKKESC